MSTSSISTSKPMSIPSQPIRSSPPSTTPNALRKSIKSPLEARVQSFSSDVLDKLTSASSTALVTANSFSAHYSKKKFKETINSKPSEWEISGCSLSILEQSLEKEDPNSFGHEFNAFPILSPDSASDDDLPPTISQIVSYLESSRCQHRTLKLSDCTLEEHATEILFSALAKNQNLSTLHLKNCDLPENVIYTCLREVLSSEDAHLKEIYLSDLILDGLSLISLLKAMIFSSASTLCLNNCEIHFPDDIDLTEMEEFRSLSITPSHLNSLHLIKIQSNQLPAFLQEISQMNIEILHLENLLLTPNDLKGLRRGLASGNGTLQTLQFVNTPLDASSFEILYNGIMAQNNFKNGVKRLCCESCEMGTKCAPLIQQLIQENTKLKHLNFQSNKLGSSASETRQRILIASMLAEKSDADLAQITLDSTESIEKSTTTEAKIRFPQMTSAAELIATALKSNQTLETLNLAYNGISLEDYEKFLEALDSNEKVTITVIGNHLQLKKDSSGELISRLSARLITGGTSPRILSKTKSSGRRGSKDPLGETSDSTPQSSRASTRRISGSLSSGDSTGFFSPGNPRYILSPRTGKK